MKFQKAGQPLTSTGISDSLASIGFHPGEAALIWSVLAVETSGFGFDAQRRPQILFERHVFRRLTNRRFDKSDPDISGPPGGYGSFAGQYGRLEKALSLCSQAGLGDEPALQSASWGLGQILGTNHQWAGFQNASAIVTAMVDSEESQLRAMMAFLLNNKLVAPLAARDLAGFARKSNGPSYWKHRYDVKLADAYARLSSGSLPNRVVLTAQAALMFLGYSLGKVDGVLSDRTRKSVKSFRITEGLPLAMSWTARPSQLCVPRRAFRKGP